MPKRYLKNPLLIFKNPYFVGLMAVCVIVWVATRFWSPEQLLNILSAPMAAFAVYGLWKWGGGTISAVADGDTSKSSLGIVGVFLIMAHLALNRGNTVGVISWGWPSYQETYTAAILVIPALFGVVFFALAARDDDAMKPQSPRTASFITGFFSAMILIFSGAAHHLVQHAGKVWKFIVGLF